MKNFKKLMILAIMSIAAQQTYARYYEDNDYEYDAEQEQQPTHQGFGRIGTAIENTLTLHPGNAVNSLATGNQSDTTYGWHEDSEGRVKANRAHTEHNNNKYYYDSDSYDDQEDEDARLQREQDARQERQEKMLNKQREDDRVQLEQDNDQKRQDQINQQAPKKRHWWFW